MTETELSVEQLRDLLRGSAAEVASRRIEVRRLRALVILLQAAQTPVQDVVGAGVAEDYLSATRALLDEESALRLAEAMVVHVAVDLAVRGAL